MNIVLLGRMASWCEPELRARLRGQHRITAIPDARRVEDHLEAIEAAEVIVGWPLSQEAARRARRLKLLHASGAGIDGIDVEALPPGVRLCNTFHHEVAIAEYVLMAMLTLSRRPAESDARLRRGNWDGSCIWGETPRMRELAGQTVLLIGLGHIAREVAVRAKAFGMRITGVSRRARADGPWDQVAGWERWEDLLAECDWVVPTCPLTPETTGLIGERQIERMKAAAWLINIARGRVVDEEALYRALAARRIAGAAIDVWYQYPAGPDDEVLPSRFPFHQLDNVFMSPHNSAWTLRTILGRAADIAENINRLDEGAGLVNVVR